MNLHDIFIASKLIGGGGSGGGNTGGNTGGGGDTPSGGEEWIGDGKTHLWIKIASEGRMDVRVNFRQTVANGVTIDWGDGSPTETLSRTGNSNITHTYTKIGEYVISLDVADGCTCILGSTTGSSVLGASGTNWVVYRSMLKKAELGNGIETAGSSSFNEHQLLESIKIPEGVTSIGMFGGCYSLENVTIPKSVTSIETQAFYGCYSLTSITIPEGVTSIGNSAFYNCYSLANIVIPQSVTSIGTQVFMECRSLKNAVIPEGVTSIENSTFRTCHSLENVTIPKSVTSIGSQAFYNCYSLTSITIPEGVTSIGNNAFNGCYSLANIVIPQSVTSIGNSTFSGCYCMKFYDFTKHTAVPALDGTTAFNNIPSDCEIRVPAALVDEWKSATNWSTYADKIVGV